VQEKGQKAAAAATQGKGDFLKGKQQQQKSTRMSGC
jgi:hypothetical protein